VCVAEIKSLTTARAVKEANYAEYLGVFAVAMAAIPICLVVASDVMALNNKQTNLRTKRKLRGQ